MSTNTATLNLVKPALTDVADIAVINTNMDLIDASIANNTSSIATNTTAIALKANESDLVITNGNVTSNTSAIATANTNIALKANESDLVITNGNVTLKANESDLVITNNNVETNTTAIASNSSKIGSTALQTTAQDLSGAINETSNKISVLSNVNITTNSGNSYSVTIPNLTTLIDGQQIRIKFNVASTGAITINPTSIGAKAVVDYFGNPVTNVRANLIANLAYEATSGTFILQGKGGGGNATAAQLVLGATATVDSGQIVGTATISSLGGKNFASGTTTVSNTGVITVNGLTFTPKLITWTINTNMVGLYNSYDSLPYYLELACLTATESFYQTKASATVTSTGFTGNASLAYTNVTAYWYAIG